MNAHNQCRFNIAKNFVRNNAPHAYALADSIELVKECEDKVSPNAAASYIPMLRAIYILDEGYLSVDTFINYIAHELKHAYDCEHRTDKWMYRNIDNNIMSKRYRNHPREISANKYADCVVKRYKKWKEDIYKQAIGM